MKLSILALVVGSAAAFTAPTMTFAVGKKAPPKKAAPAPVAKKAAPKPAPKPAAKAAPKPAPKKAAPAKAVGTIPSKALPFESAPATLDGSLPGDVGFDPVFFTSKADLWANYFNGLFVQGNPNLSGLEWFREAELIHGRIAQMAVLGFIFPAFTRLAGLEDVTSNPVAAISETPYSLTLQVLFFMGQVDLVRIGRIRQLGKDYTPGDFGWGQGEGRWNPFNFKYTPEEYYQKQVQETKHGRLAMIGILGLYFQANNSGLGIIDQLGPAFSAPGYFAKAGYFFPEGI